jgi:protein SCO1/2
MESKNHNYTKARIYNGMSKILLLGFTFILLVLQSCNCKKEENNSEHKLVTKETEKPISDLSIYNLPSKWTNQDAKTIKMEDLNGKVLVMVMIYTSCKSACPRLVADMRNIESRLPENIKKNVTLVLVSIDPATDTPERLKSFSIENKMEGEQWVFLRSTEENTREFSAVLAVNYKKISPMDFSHSNIISVFNAGGELAFQQEGLGVNSDEIINKITEEAGKLN